MFVSQRLSSSSQFVFKSVSQTMVLVFRGASYALGWHGAVWTSCMLDNGKKDNHDEQVQFAAYLVRWNSTTQSDIEK